MRQNIHTAIIHRPKTQTTQVIFGQLEKGYYQKEKVSIQEMPFGKSSFSDNKDIAKILNKIFTSLAYHLKPHISSAQEQWQQCYNRFRG